MTIIKNLLKKYHLRPSKRLGQNFLIEQKVLQKIIQAADLTKKDIVLEIGPGLGALTQELAQRAKKVMAIEKDKKMVEILKEIVRNVRNVKIIRDDILKSQISNLKSQNYKVVANLPYYITSPVIRMFLESKNPPQEMVLLVQKEVAQRICAAAAQVFRRKIWVGKPPKMSLLAVAVQFYSQPKIISYVSRKSFWPQPKVDSAIIKIVPHSPVILREPPTKFLWGTTEESRALNDKSTGLLRSSKDDLAMTLFRIKFFQIVKAGFSAPRKQLINNLSKGLKIDRAKIKKALLICGLNPQIRAESLSVEDWIKLSQGTALKHKAHP